MNTQLRKYNRNYIATYGEVGSSEWWDNYEKGFISRDIHVGQIILVGKDLSWGENPVVVIRTDRRDRAYDLEGEWGDPSVEEGVWVEIEKFKVKYITSTGPVTELIDTLITIIPGAPVSSV